MTVTANVQIRQNSSTRRRGALLGTVSAIAAVAAATVALTAGPASAQPAAPSTPQMIAMYDSPAVQLVTSNEHATVTWYGATVDLTRLVTFANQDPTTKAAWSGNDFAGASKDIVAEFARRASSYLSRGAASRVASGYTSYGSAWGISADGYLITNHHVTEPTDDATYISGATGGDSAAGTPAAADAVVASLARQLATIRWGTQDLTVTADDQATLQTLAAKWIAITSTVSGRTQAVYVGGGQSVKASDPGKPAQIIRTSPSTWPHEDVAILKVNATNLPVIPLGTDAVLQAGDTVYALGYPYDASFGSATSDTATVTATLSTGQVTNRLRTPDGFTAIEESAPTNHGSSGGVLLNAHGQAVGIVTASDSSTEKDNGVNGGKFFYAVPVSVVRKYLAAARVMPRTSPDQAIYQHAMVLMRQSHYSAALAELRKIDADGFSTPYTKMHMQMIAQAIAAGQDKPMPGHQATLLLCVVGGAALVLLATGIAIYRTARRRTVVAPVMPNPQNMYWPAPPAPAQNTQLQSWRG